MRTAFVLVTQILCLLIITYFGHSLISLLQHLDVITEAAVNWWFFYGRWLYLLCNVGLLGAALLSLLVSGKAQDNMIVASDSPLGRRLFNIWKTQNAIIAIIAAATFPIVYNRTPAELRKYLLPSILRQFTD